MKPFPRADINRQALLHNLQRLKALAPSSKIMAVVKANAYGHNLVEVCRCLSMADGFGLARLEEALELREHQVSARLLLLEGVFRSSDYQKLVAHNIDTVIHDISQVEMLEAASIQQAVKVWLKIDTGMHRLGIRPEQFLEIYQRLMANDKVAKPINLMSHFASADDPSNPSSLAQLALFERLTHGLPGERTIANSAGALSFPQAQQDWIRTGLALYGVSPSDDDLAERCGLKPAMTLVSRLIAVRPHKQGEAVGYGGTWQAPHDTRLGVVAIGYGDGYPRNAPIGTPVWVNGRECPIVGRVSMDMLTIDLGLSCQDKAGDEVIMWGEQLPVERVAKKIGTISYELVTKLTPRVAVTFA
ncbi:alanine racemase [Paraferrimonas haliotis]|uniref:Alanine racemase n=1 Tax=Paraferrimonas haliotis TaxID=2013866 RepID=A0AA37TKS0_9GAMM|nr:alanine racemase [Paraferrimonas haliotis]GLS83287.1 alanine racemase [Paraferrimonas haliotis]